MNPKDKLHELIQEHYVLSQERNGAPRIACDIKSKGFLILQNSKISLQGIVNKLTLLLFRSICQVIRSQCICARWDLRVARKFKVSTTGSNHGYNICENLLNREFYVECSSKVWVYDITYIHTKDGFIYLTIVIGLYGRKAIGWNIGYSLSPNETVITALKMAIKRRTLKPGMIFHSDHRVQYTCNEFVNILRDHNIVQSMSRKGNYWDNAVAESFFKTPKCELIYGNSLISPKQMSY